MKKHFIKWLIWLIICSGILSWILKKNSFLDTLAFTVNNFYAHYNANSILSFTYPQTNKNLNQNIFEITATFYKNSSSVEVEKQMFTPRTQFFSGTYPMFSSFTEHSHLQQVPIDFVCGECCYFNMLGHATCLLKLVELFS